MEDRHKEDRAELLNSTLFRYQSLETEEHVTRECDALANAYQFWPSPLEFNDPFDCRPALFWKGTKRDHWNAAKRAANDLDSHLPRAERRRKSRQALKIKPSQIVETMRLSTDSELAEYGVCCLTPKNDNILMWSHYAGNHSGICLGFKPSSEALDFACAYRVQYQQLRPKFNLVRSMMEQNIFEALVTKSSEWAYEEEWRLLDERITNRKRAYPPAALTHVIFGCRIEHESQQKVIDAVEKGKSTPVFFQASVDDENFALNIGAYAP